MFKLYILVLAIFLTSVGCSLDAELLRLSSSQLSPIIPNTVVEPGPVSFNVRKNMADSTAQSLQIFGDDQGHLLYNSDLGNRYVKKMTATGAALNLSTGESQYESLIQTLATAYDSSRQRFIQVGYTYENSSNNSYMAIEVLTKNGVRDTSFNSGAVTSYLSPSDSWIKWAGVDSTGAIYIVGHVGDSGSSNRDMFVVRYLPSGALDTSYGTNGYTRINVNPGRNESPASCDFTSDDRLVCGGKTYTVFFIVMLDNSGQLDTTFSTDGIIVGDFTGNLNDDITSIAVDKSTDRIYALGADTQHTKMLALSVNGTRDMTFAGTGALSLNGKVDYRDSLSVTSSGQLIAVGGFRLAPDKQLSVVRIQSNGVLDSSFGTNGVAIFSDIKRSETATKMTTGVFVDSADNIYAYGNALDSALRISQYIVKVTSSGMLDSSFGTGGILRPHVLISSDETVISSIRDGINNFVFGSIFNQKAIFLSKNTGSVLDTAFGVQGHFSYYIEAHEEMYAASVVAAKDGGFYINIKVYDGIDDEQENRILKITASGALDTTFSGDGISIIPEPLVMSDVRLVVDDNNDVYSFSVLWDGPNADDLQIHKIKADGTMDSTFGSGGERIINQHFWPLAAEFKDGRILLAGNGYASVNDLMILALLPDGSLDTTFGSSGVTTFATPSENSTASFHFTADNKMTIFASSDVSEEVFLARLDAQGAPDSSWGVSGFVNFLAASSSMELNSMVLDEQGRVWLAGADDGVRSVIIRLSSAGVLDTTFANNGYLVDLDFYLFKAISLEANGLITVVGEGRPDGLNWDAVLVRYNQDGTR